MSLVLQRTEDTPCSNRMPSPDRRAHICVRRLGAESIELDVCLPAKVIDLKQCLSTRWGIPAPFQHIVLEAAVLTDCASLEDFLDDSESSIMEVTLIVINLDGLAATHLSPNVGKTKRLEFLRAFTQYASTLKARGVPIADTAKLFLTDRLPEVREEALRVLPAIFDASDEQECIETIVSLLEDPLEFVRKPAIVATVAIAHKPGNVFAIEHVAQRLKSIYSRIRLVARIALVGIGEKLVAECVIREAMLCVERLDDDCRAVAAQALGLDSLV
eukprot:TRINITY_DN57631_c0_g1_i1.p1 TRINITY_DN57631_c0_g1~~TRINITY_DN57631_c0_g1_i1.p1  ORF type:complete len:273 (-),score=59.51 TRINITY_DN57631_c0_g1_i1:31-849(-)